jgi:AraC-like DNA-binding protein
MSVGTRRRLRGKALATIQRLSTSAVPPRDRLAYWNEASEKAFGAMVVDAEPERFQASLTRLRTEGFELVSVSSTAGATRSAARQVKIASDDAVFRLQLVHSGSSLMRHGGHETEVRAGDLIVADVSKPYDLAFKAPLHGLTISLPWNRFSPYAETLEALTGRRIDADRGAAAVLSGFVRSVWREVADGDGDDWPGSAEEVIWDLLQAVLGGEGDEPVGGRRKSRLRLEAKAHADARLADPGFGSPQLADALGISSRYLQAVFAEAGTTPSRFLLARRLEAAAVRLRRPGKACSITDVAFGCGFNDLSYFSRSFRRRFGLSPLAYRLLGGEGPAAWH